MLLQIIESSSAGNCGFLQTPSANILIDAGVGIRKIDKYLSSKNLSRDDIDAVFITHEHIDHYRALRSFKNTNAKIFANRLTADSIKYLDPETQSLDWRIFDDGVPFRFMDVALQAFSVPHDTSDAVGFAFFFECGKTLVWATDLGKVTFSVEDMARRANVLVLESNYCPVMLDNSSRPYSLKTRIKNSHGHLSNADAIALLGKLDRPKIERVFLGHVSRECNDVGHIKELLRSLGDDFVEKIEVVSPFSASSAPFVF